MIKKSIKRKWLKALRSGEYKQGDSSLGSAKYGYCCLGVLASIVDPTHKSWTSSSSYFGTNGNTQNKDLSESERQSLREQEVLLGGLIPPKTGEKLALMNDGGGKFSTERGGKGTHTFAEIADFIERSKNI